MKKSNLLIALLMALAGTCPGQSGPFDLNFEFQAYPTGLIPGLRLEKGFAEKNAVSLRLGYQIIDHRDLAEHDDETGNGFGFSLGYKRYLSKKENYQGLFAGIRNDFWWNEIDWVTHVILENDITGTTDITVVQPTAELGYQWVSESGWALAPSIAFGMEINVKTEGEATGQGGILLLGVLLGKRF